MHLKHYKNLEDALKRPNEVYILELSPFNDAKLKGLIAGNKSEQLKAYYEQIGKLKYLRELRFSNCQLTVIPESVNKCKYLETISIHVNKGLNWDSTFTILAGNAALKNIRITDSGVVDLSKLGLLKNLKNLELSYSEIMSSSHTPELFSLQRLVLNNNNLTKYPTQLTQAPNLKEITISDNPNLDLKDMFMKISLNSNIAFLSLYGNNLDTAQLSV
jgi:Leucine-rich repeat (LRR) protein